MGKKGNLQDSGKHRNSAKNLSDQTFRYIAGFYCIPKRNIRYAYEISSCKIFLYFSASCFSSCEISKWYMRRNFKKWNLLYSVRIYKLLNITYTGWKKSTLPKLNPKYLSCVFNFFKKKFAIRTGKGLQIIYIYKKLFKNQPGLSIAQNSEVTTSSLRAPFKIANNLEKYFQQMALMV